MNRETGTLDDVREFRRAARTITTDQVHDKRAKCLALLRLRDRAAYAGSWSRRAVEEEAAAFLRGESAPFPIRVDPVVTNARHLRGRGYDRCPTCARQLHTEEDFAIWSIAQRAGDARLAAFEGAVT
jgi:hypothetical protein